MSRLSLDIYLYGWFENSICGYKDVDYKFMKYFTFQFKFTVKKNKILVNVVFSLWISTIKYREIETIIFHISRPDIQFICKIIMKIMFCQA